MEATAQMELRDYIRAILKRWVFIVLFTLTVTLAGGVYSLTVPAKYIARARVIMRNTRGNLVALVPVGAGAQTRANVGQLSLNTYAKLLTSSQNAKRVAQRLAARTSGERIIVDPAEVVQALKAYPEEPDVIRVEAEASTPERAIAIANEAADSFVVLVGDFHRAEETAARQFLEQQLERTDEEISRLESELSRLRREAEITVADIPAPGDQTTTAPYVNLLQRYVDELARTDAEISATEAALRGVRSQLAGRKPYDAEKVLVPNPVRVALEKQLQTYQSALADMLTRYTPDHPAVVDLKSRVAELSKQVAKMPPTVEQVSVQQDKEYGQLRSQAVLLEGRLSELRGRRQRLAALVNDLRDEAKRAAALRQRSEAITAQLELLRQIKQRLIADIQVRKMNEAVKTEGAAVLDRAVTARPATPRLSRALMFAFILGLAISCGLAILFEILDDTIYDPDDLRRYSDLTYLGMVPRMEGLQSPLVVLHSPKSPYAEAYRSIRAQVNFRLWETPAKAILVTSALAGEGKTLTVANLAVAYAQAGQQVLVLDADLRRPACHKLFEVESERGLSNVLVGEATVDEVVRDTVAPGVRLIPSGPLPPNPAELLQSERMRQVIEDVKQRADIVLLDSPPCLVMTDAVAVAAYCDHVLLVIQAGQLNARELEQTLRSLEAARVSVLGAVLNRVPLTRGGYYYYYYYYYYQQQAGQQS